MADFPITRFGGLRLDLEPDEVGPGEAIDLLNVDLDRRGAVRSRDGYAKLNAVANAVSFASGPFAWNARPWTISSGTDFKLYVYNYAGTLLYTSAALTQPLSSVAPFGTGTSEYLYYAQGSAATIGRLTTAGVFSSPAGMPTAPFIAVQSSDNRLAAAPAVTSSRVQFSDAGDAETWGATNYVDLTPNDGDEITGLVAWRDLLFAFKQNRFFVFYGNSIDAGGLPDFNYRTIDTGVGGEELVDGVPGGEYRSPLAVAAPDAVYFINKKGVYRTTGGVAQKVSGPLDPLFTGAPTPYGTLVAPIIAARGLTYLNGRVFLNVIDNAGLGSAYILAYDIEADQWLIWQTAHTAVGLAAFRAGATAAAATRLCFASGTRIYTQGYSDTTDDGTAITSRYRSGFYAPSGDPAQESALRESIIDGIGAPTFSVSRDFATALPTTAGGAKATVTLGTSPAIAQGRHRIAQRGRRYSYQIEATSAWRVESITQNIVNTRPLGMKTV